MSWVIAWILGLGTRFSEADCSSWENEYTFNFPPTKLIHIDIDPAEIGRNYPVAIGAVADLGSVTGILAGSATGAVLESFMSEQAVQSWGWRIPFWIGLLVGLAGLTLRRGVRDQLTGGRTERAP